MKTKYRTIYLSVLLMAFSLTVMAQSADANYVKTEVFTTPEGTNNLVTIDYLDKKGRVSQKLCNGTGDGNYLRTYFEYNNEGKLGKVSSPMASQNDVSYRKAYDLSMESEASYDGDKFAYATLTYDGLGRLCIQGTCTQATQIEEKNEVFVEPLRDGIAHTGYVCLGNCNIQNLELEEVCYYDNYTFLTRSLFYNAGVSDKLAYKECVTDGNTTISLSSAAGCSKGLLTGKYQACSSGESLYSAHYYDSRGRLVESVSSYGTDKRLQVAYALNYIGQPQKSLSLLSYKGKTHSFASTNSYHQTTGKRLKCMLSIDGQSDHVISKLEYDKLGRMISQAQGISTTNYKYNVRGWLRGINSPGLDEELMYTYYEVNEGYNSYSGNLATMEFSLPNNPERHHVEYCYDGLGRLQEGKFYVNEDGYIPAEWNYGVLIPSYDLNGSITSLVRKGRKDDGTFGLVDDLEFKYMGNQLMSVEDKAEDVFRQGSTDFKDNAGGGVEYTFDENGNMSDDGNTGIAFCEYDRLNFPRRIFMSDGHQVEYDYTPSGGKLKVVHRLLSPEPFSAYDLNVKSLSSSSVIDSDTTEYLGNFILRNGEVDKVLFAGGFATMSEGTAKYHYRYRRLERTN